MLVGLGPTIVPLTWVLGVEPPEAFKTLNLEDEDGCYFVYNTVINIKLVGRAPGSSQYLAILNYSDRIYTIIKFVGVLGPEPPAALKM